MHNFLCMRVQRTLISKQRYLLCQFFLTSYTGRKQKYNIICALVPKENFTPTSFANLKQQLLDFAMAPVLTSFHRSQKIGSLVLSSVSPRVQHYSRNHKDRSTSFPELFPRRLRENCGLGNNVGRFDFVAEVNICI